MKIVESRTTFICLDWYGYMHYQIVEDIATPSTLSNPLSTHSI